MAPMGKFTYSRNNTMLSLIHCPEDVLGMAALIMEGVQVIAMISTIFPVESAMKKSFDENGNRR